MKKLLSLLVCAAMLVTMIPSFAVSAATNKINIQAVDVYVDVPVHGLPLNKKGDVEIGAVYTSTNNVIAEFDPWDLVKARSITWYEIDSNGSWSSALPEGKKAELGKTYRCVVMIEIKDGDYQFADGFETNRYTLINSETPDTISILTDGNGNKFPTYAMNYDCIPASTVKPQIVVKNLVLSPYEGNPAEFEIEVIGGTNVRYQWQMTDGSTESGSGLTWSPCIDLADDAKYRGCRTNHFKMHTYFGDTFHSSLDWMNMRCKVTSDQGTFYSGMYWYSTIPRNVVSSATFTGITTPVSGAVPDRTAVSGDTEKYTVTGVDWLGPKTESGTYTYKLTGNEKFTAGTYKCRIKVAPTEKYKFDTATTATVDGKAASIVTVDGSQKNPTTGDTYIIEKEFTIAPQDKVINGIYLQAPIAVAGSMPNENYIASGEGYTITDYQWLKENTKTQQYDAVTGAFSENFQYRLKVTADATDGYKFAERTDLAAYINDQTASVVRTSTTSQVEFYVDMVAITPQFTVQPVGGKADIGTNSKTVSWEVNFTPVKAVLFTRSIQGDYILRPVAEGANFTKANVHDIAQVIRVYYDNYNYIQSEPFYITQALDVFFTSDSNPTVGGNVTVDIERTVEQDDEWMEAYFDDAITYQWYRNYEAISGATGQSYTITEDDAGEEISVTLTRTSDGKFLKSAKITIPSSDILMGDTNGDGKVNISDAMQAFYFVNEKISLDDAAQDRADINGDGSLTIADAMKIFYYVNEKIDSL